MVMKRKKIFAFAIVLFLMTGFFSSTINMETSVYASQGRTVLKFLCLFGDYQSIYDNLKIKDAYKRSNPGVDLQVDFDYSFGDLEERVKEACNDYDVILIPGFFKTVEECSGDLAPLNHLEAVKNSLFTEDIKIGGNVYGVPCTMGLEQVLYRKSIFKEYNLSVPQTWSEFVQVAKTIKAGGKYIPIAMRYADSWPMLIFTQSLSCLEYGSGALWDSILEDKKPFSKGKPLNTALSKLKTLYDEDLFHPYPLSSLSEDSVSLFQRQKAAMLCWRDYIQQKLYSDADIGSFFLPVREKASEQLKVAANINAYMLVPEKSKNRNEAFKFVNWHFGKDWYPSFINMRYFSSTQKNIAKNYPPIAREAFDHAGKNLRFVAPYVDKTEFSKVVPDSLNFFLGLGLGIFEGGSFDENMHTYNRQWESAITSGAPFPPLRITPDQKLANTEQNFYTDTEPKGQNPRDPVASLLDEAVMVHANYPYAFVNTVKTRISTAKTLLKPSVSSKQVLVPVSFFQDAFGADVAAGKSSASVSFSGKTAVFTAGSSRMKMGNRNVKLGAAVQKKDNTLFIPLKGVVENLLGKQAVYSAKMAVVYDEKAPAVKSEKILQGAEAVFTQKGILRVTVDPRMELISVLKLLSGQRRITQYDSTYRRAVLKYFSPYLKHPAVEYFRRYGSVTSAFVLNLSAPPALTLQAPFSDPLMSELGSEEVVMRHIEMLRQFAVDTNFMAFYDSCRKHYDIMIDKVQNMLEDNDYIRALEEYYGYKQQSYNMVLGPLMADVSFGPSVEWEKGAFDTYNVICALNPEEDVPAFGSALRIREKIWHEFGHSYINKLVDGRWSEMVGFSSLMDTIRYAGGNYGDSWPICVYEHLVRAVTTRLAYREDGKVAGDRELKSHEDFGFAFIADVCKRLEEYESNRDKYPTFDDFYPRLVDLFKELSAAGDKTTLR